MKINFIHAARRLYWHCSILCFTVYWRTLLVFSFLHWVVNSGDQQGRICRCTFEQVVRASKHFCKHPSHIAFKREVFSLTCVLSILSEFRSWKWWCNEPINCLRFRIWTKWASLSRIKELEWISYFLSWEPNLGLRPATECFTTQTKVSIYRKTKERHKIERQATKERGEKYEQEGPSWPFLSLSSSLVLSLVVHQRLCTMTASVVAAAAASCFASVCPQIIFDQAQDINGL